MLSERPKVLLLCTHLMSFTGTLIIKAKITMPPLMATNIKVRVRYCNHSIWEFQIPNTRRTISKSKMDNIMSHFEKEFGIIFHIRVWRIIGTIHPNNSILP